MKVYIGGTGILVALMMMCNFAFSATCQKMTVPAYEYPFSWLAGQTPPVTMWEKIAAKHTPNADIIFNPNSGPGGGPGSPEYADYTWAVNLIDAEPGLKPVAYIATTWGNKPLTAIQTEIDNYLAWYPQTVGFFLDEADTSLAKLSYYQDIVNMIGASMGGGNRRVIINFGTYPLTDDHFKMIPTNNSFISFVTFEGLYNDYLALVPPAWAANYDSKMHVHMVYKTPFANYQAVMALAQARNVKNVYVTNDWQSGSPAYLAPYDTLTSYNGAEVNYAACP